MSAETESETYTQYQMIYQKNVLLPKKNLSKHERLLWRRFVVAVEAVQQVGGLHHPNAGIKLMVSGRPSSVPNHDAEIVYCTIMVHAMAL